jgi:Uncharacterized conserved protein (DUF2190)
VANECIPYYRPGQDVTALTTTAVVGKTFVDWTTAWTTNLGSVGTAAGAGKVAGVAAYDAPNNSKVAVIRGKGQIVPVTAGGTIAAGAEVEVGTGGKVVTSASGVKVGRALGAGANNQDCIVELY